MDPGEPCSVGSPWTVTPGRQQERARQQTQTSFPDPPAALAAVGDRIRALGSCDLWHKPGCGGCEAAGAPGCPCGCRSRGLLRVSVLLGSLTAPERGADPLRSALQLLLLWCGASIRWDHMWTERLCTRIAKGGFVSWDVGTCVAKVGGLWLIYRLCLSPSQSLNYPEEKVVTVGHFRIGLMHGPGVMWPAWHCLQKPQEVSSSSDTQRFETF